jgi:2-polyprenyl-3-methyl-5-hydroxy-6-metoxy-1,4-benzoquinol methylase
MTTDKKEWFEEWFDTSYYHTLYKHRNHDEAKLFIENLTSFLKIDKAKSHVLDLACGKGRHSVFLNQLGYSTKGVDLSQNSIQHARQFENDRLSFAVQDMREPLNETFTHIFNLFTSFGYFDAAEENKKVIFAIEQMLESEGVLVIDFMNSTKVINNLVQNETKEIDGITFNIQRTFDGTHIFKTIQFNDKNQNFHFTERVQALQLNDFSTMLNATSLQIMHIFGDFNLNAFDELTSDRLIIIAKKNI